MSSEQSPPPQSEVANDSPVAVLLYDGECGLCQAILRTLLRMDRGERLHWAPLQSDVATDFLRSRGLPEDDFDSLVFVPDWSDRKTGNFKLRSDGALAALAVIGGVGRWFGWLRVVPVVWRDALYRAVAVSRKKLWRNGAGDVVWPSSWLARRMDLRKMTQGGES